jgi:hypothetical protein
MRNGNSVVTTQRAGGGRSGIAGRAIALALVALLIDTGIASAKVFFRWGASANSGQAMESAGGRPAYSADIAVNGGTGRLQVFAFPTSLADTLRTLRATFAGAALTQAGGSMATALVKADGRVVRFAAIQLSASPETLVFYVDQSEQEYEASLRAPEEHRLRELPAFPGSTPVFFARDDTARMSIEVSATATDAQDIQSFYETRLAGDGWKPALETRAGQKPVLGMETYLRGRDVCCVLVDRAPDGGNRITLLHKRPGVE